MTHDMWHVTRDTGHVTHDTQGVVNIVSKIQFPTSNPLGVLFFFKDLEENYHVMNQ